MAKATSKVVRIACQGAATMPLKDLLPFQGALKSLADEDYERLKKLILRLGFSFPFHIWREKAGKVTHHHILDGHQRLETLSRMAADPEIIVPLEFPVDWVEAGTLREAKEKVLASVSQFGKVEAVGLADFAKEAGISFVDLANNFRFPEIDMSGFGKAVGSSSKDGEDKEELYTKKIKAPIYEIKGEKPEIETLVDTSKTETIIKKIDGAKIPKDVKEFLRQAAHRHRVFNYERIAEYYAHAPLEVQDLMEESALVIIDFDKAIENGFVVLSERISSSYSEIKDEE